MENIYAVITETDYDCDYDYIVDFYCGLECAIKFAKSLEGFPYANEVTVTKTITDDNGLICESWNKDNIVYHWERKDRSK